jgi:sulfur relay (sulfurtransferase) DsrC/TusE family protein
MLRTILGSSYTLGRTERISLFQKLESALGSKVISYITSDRENNLRLQMMIGDEVIRPLHRQLELIGRQETINLFLYTRGGLTETAWRIVKLFREYAKNFRVIVPFRAHSAGTEIALGADSILMTELAELGPVDPTTGNEFNPIDPLNKGRRIPISVEDVKSFLKLAEERAGLDKQQEKLQTFQILANRYEPLALGNVNRVYDEIRSLVRNLLGTHMNEETETAQIEAIVKALTETYTHEHPITRDQAEKIGLKVSRPSPEVTKLILELYEEYESDLALNEPFDSEDILGSKEVATTNIDGAILESSKSGMLYRAALQLTREMTTPSGGGKAVPTGKINVKLKMGRWISIK